MPTHNDILPTPGQAYELLRAQGEQYPQPRPITPLEGVVFTHPRKGEMTIELDEQVLATQGHLYAGDPTLRAALWQRHIATSSLEKAGNFIRKRLENDELIWGFSGYATAGYNYAIEADGLMLLHDHLAKQKQKPSLVIDGGVSAGNLGLSGIIATMHGIENAGVIPKQGLNSLATRDHMIIWGDTYRDRETLIGTIPDVLTCIDGGEGTIRECQTALRLVSSILLLALKDTPMPGSLPTICQDNAEMTAAINDGTMVVCRSAEAIAESADQAIQAAARGKRQQRLNLLAEYLG